MNALPHDHRRSLNANIDNLIADFGIRRVFLALTARVFVRKSSQATMAERTRLSKQDVATLSNHLRKDIGLPPYKSAKHYLDYNLTKQQNLF